MKHIDNIPNISYDPARGDTPWWANCPRCGALVYATVSPRVIKEVLDIERSYCPHCGIKFDVSTIEISIYPYLKSMYPHIQ